MSIDASAVQPGANAAAPPPAVPDLAGWVATQAQQAIAKTVEDGVAQITAQVTATATEAAQDAKDTATTLHDQSISAIREVAASVTPKVQAALTDAIPQIKASVLADVQAVGANIQHDAITQRHIALLVVLLLGAAALALFVAYLVGSPQAKGIVGWALAPGGLAAVVAWASTGFKLPNKPAA